MGRSHHGSTTKSMLGVHGATVPSGSLVPDRSLVKAKLQRLSWEKAKLKLEALAAAIQRREPQASSQDAQKAAIVVLAGPFNPPHRGHETMLEAAARAVKARTGTSVFAGFYAPLSDREGAAQDEEARPFSERCDLCRLAAAASGWIDVCEWGWSDSRLSDRMLQQLEQNFAWTGGLRWEFEVWHVAGNSGQLLTHLRRRQFPSVCIAGRAPNEPFLARCLNVGRAPAGRQPPTTAWRSRCYGPRGTLLGSSAASTNSACGDELRALAAGGHWEELAQRGWLTEAVLQRLKGSLQETLQEAQQQDEADAHPAANAAEEDAAGLIEGVEPAEDCRAGEKENQQPAKPVVIAPPSGGPIEMSAARVHQTNGNAAKASQCGGKKVIAHFTNDQGNGGRGFFQEIKEQWGAGPSREYFEWHRDRGHNDFRMGAVQFVEVSRLVEVANIIGEAGNRSGSRGPPMRCDAIEEALQALGQHAAKNEASVHIPRIIRGGQWDKIHPLLKKMSAAHGVEVYVYGK